LPQSKAYILEQSSHDRLLWNFALGE
jgi:hypothetical protein